MAADFSGTQWHNYFTGNFTGLGLTVAVTAVPGSGTPGGFGGGGGGGGGGFGGGTGTGVSEPLVLASTGGTATTKMTQITVITVPPGTPPGTAPAPVLDANSDTGASNSDDITQDNNSTLFPSPVFDVPSAEDGTTVQLYRTPVNPQTHLATGPTVLVNTLTNKPMGTIGIADINQSDPTLQTPGLPILDGTYLYAVQLIDLAGNATAISPGLFVTIATVTPAPPPQPILATDTGAFNNDNITDTNNSAIAATATAMIDIGSTTVASITVTPGTAFYASPPTVTITNGGGTGATAMAVLTGGVVTSIKITNPGSGYTSNPTVTIASPVPDPPVFTVSGVLPNATVVLYRNNQEVSRITSVTGGTVSISDLNGGSQPGQNPIIDSGSQGVYVYRVEQIDVAGNASPFSSPLTVTIDHTPPVAPFPPVLEAGQRHVEGSR